MPVVKNVKKTYVDNSLLSEDDFSDIINLELNGDLENIRILLENYKTNTLPNEQNKYSALYKELNPHFTPFDYISDEQLSESIIEKMTETDINVIIDNLGQLINLIYVNPRVYTLICII